MAGSKGPYRLRRQRFVRHQLLFDDSCRFRRQFQYRNRRIYQEEQFAEYLWQRGPRTGHRKFEEYRNQCTFRLADSDHGIADTRSDDVGCSDRSLIRFAERKFRRGVECRCGHFQQCNVRPETRGRDTPSLEEFGHLSGSGRLIFYPCL